MKRDIKELKLTTRYLGSAPTMKKILDEFKMIISYGDHFYEGNDGNYIYKLFVNVEKVKDDAKHYNYLVSCNNEKDYRNIKENLCLKKSEYNLPTEDEILVKALKTIYRLFSREYD